MTIVHAKEELTFTPLVRPFAFMFKEPKVDLDKLSKAVACAETSCGKDGTARGRNNWVGYMCWDKQGKRYPCTFKTPQDSLDAFKKTWSKSYQRMADLDLAHKYTGGDNFDTWTCNVHRVYYEIDIKDCHKYLRVSFPAQYAKYF